MEVRGSVIVLTTNKFSVVDGPFGSDLKLTDYDPNGDVPVLTITMMYDTRKALNARRITNAKFEQVKRSAVRGGDILVAKIGNTYGLTCIYPPDYPVAIIPANMCKITPDNALISTKYLRMWLRDVGLHGILILSDSSTGETGQNCDNEGSKKMHDSILLLSARDLEDYGGVWGSWRNQAITRFEPQSDILSGVEKRRSNVSLPVANGGAFTTPPQSGLT